MWRIDIHPFKQREETEMMSIKRVIVIVALLTFILPGVSLAEALNFQLNASSDNIDLRVSREFPISDNYAEAGVGLYHGDDYLISNLDFALKGEVFIPELTLGLGLKGLLGEVEIRDKDFDLRAISFLVIGEYDFGKVFFNFPMNASLSFSIAPDPLCFSDTDRYIEFYAAIYLYIVKSAAIGIVYRTFEARFDDPSGKVEESDDAVLLGFKLRF
jgi:hypothetical protein